MVNINYIQRMQKQSLHVSRWHGNPALPDGLIYEGVSDTPLHVSLSIILLSNNANICDQCDQQGPSTTTTKRDQSGIWHKTGSSGGSS